GMPGQGLVPGVVAGPGADYAIAAACSGSSGDYLRVYRIVAGAAHRLRTTAEYLLGGPRHAWAVTYLAQYTLLAPELTPLNGGRAVTLKTSTGPVADTAAGLGVVVHHERAGAPDTVELLHPRTRAPPPGRGSRAGRRRARPAGELARVRCRAGPLRVHPGKHRPDHGAPGRHVPVAGRARPGPRHHRRPRRHRRRLQSRRHSGRLPA